MKVLFLFTEGLDTPSPYNHLMEALIEDSAKSIESIDVIQSIRQKKNTSILLTLEKFKNINSVFIKRPVIAKKNFPLRYIEEMVFHFRSFNVWRKLEKPDVIFVQSSPTAVYPILLSKFFTNAKIVYSVQDVFPGTALATGVMKDGVLSKTFKKIQTLAYRNADIVTAISEDMKNTILNESKNIPVKVQTIKNWFDTRNISHIKWEENKFVKKYSLSSDKFYVQYAGSMVNVFDYKTVIKIAEGLKDIRDIEIHMIGSGNIKSQFQKECEEKELNNIKFFPLEPANMVPHVYSYCDIAIIPLKSNVIYNSVPSKLGLLMKCHRPVLSLVDYNAEYSKEIIENKVGFIADTGDWEKAVDTISHLYNNQDLGEKIGKRAHEFAIQKYDRFYNTELFIKIFKNLAKGSE